MSKTIQDVYASQSASDMFFNHEGVVKAYQDSILEENSVDMVEGLVNYGFEKDDAEVIAADFLARV
jgi:hypothetical protein